MNISARCLQAIGFSMLLLFSFPLLVSAQVPCAPCDNVTRMCAPICTDGKGIGHCIPPGLCMGDSAKTLDGGQQGLDAGLKALQGLIGKALEALKGGGGGGGGGQQPPQQPPQMENFFDQQEEERNTAQDILDDLANQEDEQPSLVDSLFSQITNSFSTTTDDVEEDETDIENVEQDTNTEPQEQENEAATTSTNTLIENIATDDVQTSVQTTDSGVTISTTGVEEETNTGVGSFVGTQSRSGESTSLVGRLCRARPWETSFITRIFSARFFDSICEQRGYAVGTGAVSENTENVENSLSNGNTPEARLTCSTEVRQGQQATIRWSCGNASIRASGIGFETGGWGSGSTRVAPSQTSSYTLECAQGGVASCTVRVVAPSVQIVAHPQRVSLGATSRVFWVASEVATCEVSGPGLRESGIRGVANTGSILDASVFTLTCRTENGTVVTDETTVDIGI